MTGSTFRSWQRRRLNGVFLLLRKTVKSRWKERDRIFFPTKKSGRLIRVPDERKRHGSMTAAGRCRRKSGGREKAADCLFPPSSGLTVRNRSDPARIKGEAPGQRSPRSGPDSSTGCRCSRRCAALRASSSDPGCRTGGIPRRACRSRPS